MSWGDLDTEVKVMTKEDTAAKFEVKHSWLCGGIVLKLEDPEAADNIELFKVSVSLIYFWYFSLNMLVENFFSEFQLIEKTFLFRRSGRGHSR